MPVTIHSEKFWEGPERILDAGEISRWRREILAGLAAAGWLADSRQANRFPKTLEIPSNQNRSAIPGEISALKLSGIRLHSFLRRGLHREFGNTRFERVLAGGRIGRRTNRGNRPSVIFDIAPPGPPQAGQRHRNRNETRLRRCEPVSGHRSARLHANGYVASVPDGVRRRRRGQQRIGFSRTDHGIARRVRLRPGLLCGISRLEIMKRINLSFSCAQ